MLAVLFVGGLRRAEAVALDADDYAASSGHLTVTGKGRRCRIDRVRTMTMYLVVAW